MFKLKFKSNEKNLQRPVKKKYNIKFIPNTKNISWGHSKLCPWKIPIYNGQGKKYWTQDSDGDGVIDAWDCKPFNKRQQGEQHMQDQYMIKFNEKIRKKREALKRGDVVKNKRFNKELEDWNRKFAAAELYEKYGVPKSENSEDKVLNPKHKEKFYIKEYEKNLKEALQRDQLQIPAHQRRASIIAELTAKGTDKSEPEHEKKKKSKTVEQEDIEFSISKEDPTGIYSKIAAYETEDED